MDISCVILVLCTHYAAVCVPHHDTLNYSLLTLRLFPISDFMMMYYIISSSLLLRYSREEPFTALNVDIRNQQHLFESLDVFVKGDLLEGANAYHCEKCDKKVDTVKRMCIKKLPKILCIQLKRFDYDWERYVRTGKGMYVIGRIVRGNVLHKQSGVHSVCMYVCTCLVVACLSFYHYHREMAIKFNDYFEFPREFDMAPYTAATLAEVEGKQWLCHPSLQLSFSLFNPFRNENKL